MKTVLYAYKRVLPDITCHRWVGRKPLFSFFLLRLFLFYSILSLVSCMQDDYSDCPEDETLLTVQFAYLENDGEDHFTAHISSLILCLFDEEKTLYTIHALNETEINNDTKEITFSVDPGEYYAVAWANIQEMPVLSAGEEIYFETLTQLADEEQGTWEKAYYAPDKRGPDSRSSDFSQYQLTVPKGNHTTHSMFFMGAYHTIQVYIRGLAPEEPLPEIILSGVPAGYDYHLTPLTEETITFTQTVQPVEIEGEQLWGVAFRVPHFDNENDMLISIPQLNRTVSLQEYMEKEEITVTDGEMKEIPILFIWNGVYAQVIFPDWNSIPTEGGFK
ncbi:MAG: FimB/Mfa2 family fimbrial subunit [Tannerellaceae bacterium]|nr:FimB/Mfa2 family fimbrial subunit [Tannerellaceae bacterium]